MDALDFLKTLLDPRRLAVVGLIAAAPHTLAELVARTEQRQRDIVATLAPLIQAGIVERAGETYRLIPAALRDMAHDLPQPPPPASQIMFGMTAQEQAVLRRFFQGETLIEIPASRTKRLVVLERLALDFEPGVHYPEAQVNEMLERYHPDRAALRRYLVDEGFLDRAEGLYWRSGGRV